MEQTQLLLNPEAQCYRDYGPAQAAVLKAPAFAGAFAFLTVPDRAAVEAMCLAADPYGDDPALVIGDTGSAGWAGFLAVSSDPALRRSLGLSAASRVAVVVTEEATDAAVYQGIVGRAP
ncbi:MAG: hypothetical protein O2782_15285 [bacterium]|nr:hypothetical protein [bacterium]